MKILLAATVVLFVLGCVGEMDYQDAVDEADHYTDMVCNGYWPDYEKRSPDCSSYRRAGNE
jgi:hypothetical protein